MNEYIKQHGSYYFQSIRLDGFGDHMLVFMTEEVSVLIDRVESIVLKHGRPKQVSAYLKKISHAYPDLDHLIIIKSSNWRPDQLNALLASSGLVTKLLNETTQDSFFETK